MAVYTELSTVEIQSYAQAFSLGPVLAAQGVAAGTINTIYDVRTKKGRYIFRLLEDRALQDCCFEIELTRFLSRRSFAIPRMHRTRSGEPWVQRSPSQYLFVFDFLAGSEPTVDSLQDAQLDAIADFLGRFHRLGSGFSEQRENAFASSALLKKLDGASGWANQRQKKHLKTLEQTIREAGFLDLPHGPIHSDLFLDNTLFCGKTLSAVIDWEMACTGPLLYDLAVIFCSWCFVGGQFDARRMRRFLQVYQRQRILVNNEVKELKAMIIFVAARFAISRFYDFEKPLGKELVRLKKDYLEYMSRLHAAKNIPLEDIV